MNILEIYTNKDLKFLLTFKALFMEIFVLKQFHNGHKKFKLEKISKFAKALQKITIHAHIDRKL